MKRDTRTIVRRRLETAEQSLSDICDLDLTSEPILRNGVEFTRTACRHLLLSLTYDLYDARDDADARQKRIDAGDATPDDLIA